MTWNGVNKPEMTVYTHNVRYVKPSEYLTKRANGWKSSLQELVVSPTTSPRRTTVATDDEIIVVHEVVWYHQYCWLNHSLITTLLRGLITIKEVFKDINDKLLIFFISTCLK